MHITSDASLAMSNGEQLSPKGVHRTTTMPPDLSKPQCRYSVFSKLTKNCWYKNMHCSLPSCTDFIKPKGKVAAFEIYTQKMLFPRRKTFITVCISHRNSDLKKQAEEFEHTPSSDKTPG